MDLARVDPELRAAYRRLWLPPLHRRWVVGAVQGLSRLRRGPRRVDGRPVAVLPSGERTGRLHRPERPVGAALLWIHGGGYLVGAPWVNDRACARLARELGLVVLAAGYRLAPRHPFPAALDDCRAAWQWLVEHASELGVDPARIAVAGLSAGGGLAAALAQRLADEGALRPAAQVLIAPMLDDRTAARRELDAEAHLVWDNRANRAAWRWYLGRELGVAEMPPYAVPARRPSLAGLPPAWIGVGDVDLFWEEDRAYAERLAESGVSCTFVAFPGAPHGFETFAPHSAASRRLWTEVDAFLRRYLGLVP